MPILTQEKRNMTIDELRSIYITPTDEELATLPDDDIDWCECHGYGKPCLFKPKFTRTESN